MRRTALGSPLSSFCGYTTPICMEFTMPRSGRFRHLRHADHQSPRSLGFIGQDQPSMGCWSSFPAGSGDRCSWVGTTPSVEADIENPEAGSVPGSPLTLFSEV